MCKNAVILAGGKGTRLAPYTTVFPKPLVPLGHHPILEIIIRQLNCYGIENITLSLGYLGELIQSYVQTANGKFSDINIRYVKEEKPLGTAGSLALIPDFKDTCIIMNGDILTTMDYSKFVEFHKSHGGILTIAMYEKSLKIDLGIIKTNSDGILTDYIEKPEKKYDVSMGIYVYEPEVIKYIEPGKYLDFPELVVRLMEKGEKVIGYPFNDFWLDIGRHEDYALAQELFESMKDRLLPSVHLS